MYNPMKSSGLPSTPSDGSSRLELMLSGQQYFLVTTPKNGDLDGWYLELSFVARVVTYIAILGFIMLIIFLLLKFLSEYEADETSTETTHAAAGEEVSETSPMLTEDTSGVRGTDGTREGDEETASSTSSEDQYNEKLCVICYEEERNCFFVPCGHCATCHGCARRIMKGEGKVCPICRKVIRKSRRLSNH